MEIRDLECFLAVSNELSFTRAAERLHIAQPALSLRIRQFERKLGATLFNRTKRKVELSIAGATLEPRARQIVAASRDAAVAVRNIAAGEAGILRIGAFYSAIYTVLPGLIRRFSGQYPHVEIQIKEAIVTEQIKLLRQGDLDIGIVRLERAPSDIHIMPLVRESYVCALPSDHALATAKNISLRDIAGEPIITLDPQFNAEFYSAIVTAFANKKLSPRIINKASDMHLVLGLVSAGRGVSLVPSSIAQIRHRHIVFKNITDRLPKMTIQLARHIRSSSPIIHNFEAISAPVHRNNAGPTTRRTRKMASSG